MATFRDLKTFVERAAGWTEDPSRSRARSRTGDHWRYQRTTPDGRVLRTKVSHALGDDIGRDLWNRILRHQLEVTEEQFWAVIRGQGVDEEPAGPLREPLPGWLIERLIHTVGLAEVEIRALSLREAHVAWEEYQSREHTGDA